MKKAYQLLLLVFTALIIAGCSHHIEEEHDKHDHEEEHHDEHEEESHEGEHEGHEEHHALGEISSEDRISFESTPIITTTFYPIEEITKSIIGNKAQVDLIVDLGVDPHSFEPKPSQLVRLSNSNLYIGLGGLFTSIEEELLEANENILSFDAAHDVIKVKPEEHEHHEEHEDEHDEHEEESHEDEHEGHGHDSLDYGPHVWLSIKNMEIMTNEILENLIILAPQYEEEFRANAQVYLNDLKTLQNEFDQKLTTCTQKVAIVNHKAFGYLAEEYNFEQVSIAGFSPESEPTPQTLQKVIDEANEHGVSYVFSEGQMDPKVAQTIANDIGGSVLELNPLKIAAEETYFTIMRSNLDNLVIGLEC